MGTAYTPKGYVNSTTNQDAVDFMTGHAAYGRLIAFHMNWRDSVAAGGVIPASAVTVQTYAATYGFIPMVGFGWDIGGVPDLTSESSPADNTWANAETRIEYLNMVTAFAAQYRPRFLMLGNETNTYYLASTPAVWADWISEYRACYDAVKAASPATTVFPSFQIEHLKGLGVKNGWTDAPQWGILADYAGKMDAAGFTSYPYFEYETPQDIPAGYYDEILTYWTGPVIFTEIGWVADPAVPYTGSEQEQSDFVTVFFDRTARLTLGYVAWLARHDIDVAAPSFRQIGLRANDGTPRAADAVWRSLVR
jgi:hypothetical protein